MQTLAVKIISIKIKKIYFACLHVAQENIWKREQSSSDGGTQRWAG